MLPCRVPIQRIAWRLKVHILRQDDRQIGGRHWDDAAALAMDHRDRAAPIALARDAPIPQLEIDLPLALRPAEQLPRLQAVRDLVLGGLDCHAIEETRIDQQAIAVESLGSDPDSGGI